MCNERGPIFIEHRKRANRIHELSTILLYHSGFPSRESPRRKQQFCRSPPLSLSPSLPKLYQTWSHGCNHQLRLDSKFKRLKKSARGNGKRKTVENLGVLLSFWAGFGNGWLKNCAIVHFWGGLWAVKHFEGDSRNSAGRFLHPSVQLLSKACNACRVPRASQINSVTRVRIENSMLKKILKRPEMTQSDPGLTLTRVEAISQLVLS